MSNGTCKTCKFWYKMEGASWGDCKKHQETMPKPPTDWCGDYEEENPPK